MAHHRRDVHMLNPITRTKITLPPITTFPDVEAAVRDSSGALTGFVFSHGNCPPATYPPIIMQEGYFTKIIVAPGPAGIGSGDYTVLAIAHFYPMSLAFARGGDDKWTSLQSVYDALFYDIIYYKGLFYGVSALTGLTKLVTFDLSGAVPEVKQVSMDLGEPPIWFERFYVVEWLGELIVVKRSVTFLKEGDFNRTTFHVNVFWLDRQQDRWWYVFRNLKFFCIIPGIGGVRLLVHARI